MQAPETFESRIHYSTLCEVLSLTLHGGNTKFPHTNCPFCKISKMRIYRDFTTMGWRWFCDHCNRSWTSFQLYQHVNNFPTVSVAWHAFLNDTGHRASSSAASALPDTILTQENQDNIHNTIISSINRLSKILPHTAIGIMETLGIWRGWTEPQFKRTIGQFIGCLSWYQAIAFSDHFNMNKAQTMKFVWANCLIIPFEVTPGQVSSVVLFDSKENVMHKTFKNQLAEGGLLGLSNAINCDDKCFVVFDPALFLHMQAQWMEDNEKVLPLVCAASKSRSFCTANTRLAYSSLHHERVIFWDFKVDAEVINAARCVGDRAYIATKPDSYDLFSVDPVTNKHNFSNTRAIWNAVKDWDKSAKPWYEVLRKQLFKLTPIQAETLISELQPALTQEECRLLKLDCSQAEVDHINELFKKTVSVNVFKFKNLTLLERPDRGLYCIANNKHSAADEQILSNVYIKLYAIAAIRGDTFIKGKIHCVGKTIDFSAKRSDIEKNQNQWLTQKCLENDVVAQIDSRFKNQMLEVAFVISSPEVVKIPAVIGWNETRKAFTLPNITIAENSITVEKPTDGFLPLALDCLQFSTMSIIELRKWVNGDKNRKFIFGLVLATAYNSFQKSKNAESAAIAVVKPTEEALALMYKFGNTARLTRVMQASNKVHELVKFVENESTIPYLLELSSDRAKAFDWFTARDANYIFSADTQSITQYLHTGKNLLLVDGTGVDSDALNEPELQELLHVIVAILKASFTLTGGFFECVKAVLTDLSTTVDELPIRLVMGEDTYAILSLVFSALEQNLVCPTPKDTDPIFYTKTQFAINWQKMQKVLKKHGYYLRDIVEVERQLKNQTNSVEFYTNGILISRKNWKPLVKEFTDLSLPHHANLET